MKKIILITVLFLLFSLGINNRVVKADSGWDFDYDSGSSWSSDSSWDSDSSWSTDTSSSYYRSNSSTDNAGPGVILLIIIIVIIIIILANRKNRISSPIPNNYVELTDEKIKELDEELSREILHEKTYDIYKKVQNAWMDFDDETLRKNLTDEIYNMYKTDLKTLKLKNQKNIMKDFDIKDCKVISIEFENGTEKVSMYLQVSQYDYVVDKDGKVVRGTDKIKNTVEYMITLVRNKGEEAVKQCPNCGAPIDIVRGGTCPYCETTIISNSNEFVMSKKQNIGQRRG